MTRYNQIDPSAAFVPKNTPTLADLMESVAQRSDISQTRCRDLLSDLRTFAKILNMPAERILADPPWLRQRVAGISHKAEGITQKRLSNILSNVRAALRMFGIDLLGRQKLQKLIPEWEALWRPVRTNGSHALRNGLSRGVHFASRHGVTPTGVDDTFVAFFLAALEATEIDGKPKSVMRGFVRNWARFKQMHPNVPLHDLSIPARGDLYSIPWQTFPESLAAETHAFLYRSPTDDIFDLSAPDRALASATIVHREGQIRRGSFDPCTSGRRSDVDCGVGRIARWQRVRTHPEMAARSQRW